MSMAPAKLTLRALSGDLQGQAFHVEREFIIGRSTTCGIFVPDRRISREHSRVWLEDGALWVEDLGSHNGTYVNGQRVTRLAIQIGDTIRVGTSQFLVENAAPEISESIRLVADDPGMQPRLVRRVEPIAQQNLGAVVAQEYFNAIGIAPESDHFALSSERIEALFQQTRRFAILYEVSKALQRYTDLHTTLPGVLDLVLQVVGGDRAALVVLDEDKRLVPKTVRFADKTLDPADQPEIVLSKTVADYVLTERCAVITADASTDVRFASAESVVLNNIRSLLVVPVLVGNRMLGLLEFENTRNINGYNENDMHLVSIVASTLGVAIDHYAMSQARERAIGQLQAAQEQLIATQERLVISERMGVLGRLSSGIAHEVKNHLSPFMLADMIASKYPDDQEIKEASELMLEAQQRILGLVDEIRTFASGTQASVNIAPHDMCSVIEGVVRFLRCDRAVKQATIRFEPEARPLVFMDAHRIRQVLINLIRNAADALPPRDGHIEIGVRVDGPNVQVEVCDNGRGIPADVGKRIFEAFFTTKGDKGLGLGLDISRQIVIAHGGALTFESEPGIGTVFLLTLPLLHTRSEDIPFDDMLTDPLAVGMAPLALDAAPDAGQRPEAAG
ncbi:MAG: FHA domain-containing protein [Myxococcales bacterium]|nr:FHA domain-containing protein [Myxococcales bacterium]